MISIDCEMTGLDLVQNAIVSIGAVDIENPGRTFYGECQVFPGAGIDKAALGVNGFSLEECLDANKETQLQLLERFITWVQDCKEYTMIGQNVAFDRMFLNSAFEREGLGFRFSHRVVDVHTIAYTEYLRSNIAIPSKDGKPETSTLNLDHILQYVGVPEEPRPHNALTGATVSAEAFYRLVYHKNLLPQFDQYQLPAYLQK
jgi:DNA polymerase III epsilon subunit-like protein